MDPRWKVAVDDDWYTAAAAMNHINEAMAELLKLSDGRGPSRSAAIRFNSELLRLRRKIEREWGL